MGHEKKGVSLVGQRPQQGHDFLARLGIEIARRLVGQNDGGPVDQGAGDGDALALAAGHFVGFMVDAIGQPHAGQGLQRDAFAVAAVHPGVDQGQFDIAQRVGPGQEVEGLKDKADFPVANLGQLIVVQFADVGAVEFIDAGRGSVQASEQIHQG